MQLAGARLASAEAKSYWPVQVLAWLADNLTGPVSIELGKTWLQSAALRATLQRLEEADSPAGLKDDGTLVWTVAVLPSELLPSFISIIAPLPPAATRNARDFVDLVLALEILPTQ
jgi:hypothetical protein